MGRKKFLQYLSCYTKSSRHKEVEESEEKMIELEYSLIVEATGEPDYFGFYSPDLEGFTGIGHSMKIVSIGEMGDD